MSMNYKERLSQHVENIFKTYTEPGLHICDIATGGGKSYTIGKLTCEYYPEHFHRIIILCVQNKLVEGMDREIEKFITSPQSKIKGQDKLVVENNTEVVTKAVKSGALKNLIEEMDRNIYDLSKEIKDHRVIDLRYRLSWVKKSYEGICGLITTNELNNQNEYIQRQIEEGEANLRKTIRSFFDAFKECYEKKEKGKKASFEMIKRMFPSLPKAFPQVEWKKKKVLLMTVHKAMYGIDPILFDKIKISDFSEKDKQTLLLFDESDQAAIAMRDAIIDMSIGNGGGSKRYANGYNAYLQYRSLLEDPEHVSNEYFGNQLEDCLRKSKQMVDSKWKEVFGEINPYKSIFLDSKETIEEYRRGVFFSGPIFRLNITKADDKTQSYICYKKKERHLRLVHGKNKEQLELEYDVVCSLERFLSLVTTNNTILKSQFSSVVYNALAKSKELFAEASKKAANNSLDKNLLLGYPTLEREIHTLFSRFETASEYQFEQQLLEFMTNRKNLIVTKDDIKLPDYSVYSRGVQLFQEEVDDIDNQHRIRLSCREISTTPEKIILDLAHFGNTSIVFCSATASCMSVVSNFDIEYLRQIMGDSVHVLSNQVKEEFDSLQEKTYPQGHEVKIIPLEHYEFNDKRENHLELPRKYKEMFSAEARKEGLDEEWFRVTLRQMKQKDYSLNDILFRFYRLFQFIEAFHWFISENDVHSMIFFQNRTGERDKDQVMTLSSLIDGSYKEMPKFEGEIPNDWENKHIRVTKDWEEVETEILQELGNDKNAKIMLVVAYNSFKAGTNMQYSIPNGLDCLLGDNWEFNKANLKKDWDAIYLQSPTAYLMMNDDDETSFEKSLYNAMLTLMMLYERGCLSQNEVARWLYNAFSNPFFFSENTEPGIAQDKYAWAQTIIEQAVGRLCRTRNKPQYTYILFDDSMVHFFDTMKMNKSMTKEFKALVNFIRINPKTSMKISPEEYVLCNEANTSQRMLEQVRKKALGHSFSDILEDDFIDEMEEDNSYSSRASQRMLQSYKQTIIKKPVISSWDELDEEDRYLTFIYKCYGDWKRNENNEYRFAYDVHKRICPIGNGKEYPKPISTSLVRLDVLMKNKVIRDYFEKNGYATDWKKDGLILHPQILATDYAGEIGEEAFKAIVLYYTNCDVNHIRNLEGKDYELADFVICDSNGNYKIAFDVKNMRPEVEHDDRPGDIPTKTKRDKKRKKLGCEIITVNMLRLPNRPLDEIREIGGIIDENGREIPTVIEQLKNLINSAL